MAAQVDCAGQRSVAMVADGPLRAPAVPGGLRKLNVARCSAAQCEVLKAYYYAYSAWVGANTNCDQSEVHAGLPGVDARPVDEVSCVSEPHSEVSARSSASSGRAAKRARWRANKARRLRGDVSTHVDGGVRVSGQADSEVSSNLTYTVTVPESIGSDVSYTVPVGRSVDLITPAVTEGYCYEAALEDAHRDEARASLRECPSFGQLLRSPSCWFRSEFRRLTVSRVEPGLFHVSCGGLVPLATCLASVVQSSSGVFPVGSLGARPGMRQLGLSHVLLAKAPALDDLCGASRSAKPLATTGCRPCTVARAYCRGLGTWRAETLALPVSRKELSDSVLLPSGALLAVYDLGDRSAVIPFSDRKDVITTAVMGLLSCGTHSVRLAECGCSIIHAQSSDRLPVHVVDGVGLTGHSCRGHCKSGAGLLSRVKGLISVLKSGVTPSPWVISEPGRLVDMLAYRELGSYPGGSLGATVGGAVRGTALSALGLDRFQVSSSDSRWFDEMTCRRVAADVRAVSGPQWLAAASCEDLSRVTFVTVSKRDKAWLQAVTPVGTSVVAAVELQGRVVEQVVLVIRRGTSCDRVPWLFLLSRASRFGYVVEDEIEPVGLLDACEKVFGGSSPD